jgi:GNAT superfamily N-acetyltransferase
MLIIRRAAGADVPHLLELYQQLSLDPGSYQKAAVEDCRRVLRQMEKVPGYELLVAEEDSEVLGTLVVAVLPAFAHGVSPFAVVEYMVVDEKHRSRGIGRQLLEYAVEKAREAGCYKIMLSSNKRRTDAHRFYRSVGFTASHEGFQRYF